MKSQSFARLTRQQQFAMILALQVRDAIERAQVEHLASVQIAALGPVIYQGLREGMALSKGAENRAMPIGWRYFADFIPDDWEIPGSVRKRSGRKRVA